MAVAAKDIIGMVDGCILLFFCNSTIMRYISAWPPKACNLRALQRMGNAICDGAPANAILLPLLRPKPWWATLRGFWMAS